MKPILYCAQCSPPARSVLILIKILNIDVEYVFMDLFKGDQKKPEFKQINPAHTVPTLVHDDLILTDSHVILMHLCEKYQKEDIKLWPRDYKERMKVTNMLMLEGTLIFRRDSEMWTEIITKKGENVNLEYHQRKILEIYDICEAHLKNHKYFATDYLTIADLSAVTTLSTVNLIFSIKKAHWPLLDSWLNVMKSMPAYEINQKGLEEFKITIEEYGKGKIQMPMPDKDV